MKFHVLHFHVLHFHVLQFHVRHFQRPRCGLCAPASCVYFSFNTSVLIPHSVPITIASCLRACLGHHNVPLSSHESNSQETPGMSFLTTIFVLCNDLRRRFIEDNGHHSFCIRIYLFYRIYWFVASLFMLVFFTNKNLKIYCQRSDERIICNFVSPYRW